MRRVGLEFQENTKYVRGRSLEGYPSAQVAAYKTYDNAAVVNLPEPKIDGGRFLWKLLAKRRTIRKYLQEPVTLEELSQLLWATQGITERKPGGEFRVAPSAGALYPVETYLFARNVVDLDPGVYHYNVKAHVLESLKNADLSESLRSACMDQNMVTKAGVTFVWSAVFARSRNKYKDRAYRYIYMDVGHIAQNLQLGAESLGLGCCLIGAFYDDEVNRLLDLDGEDESIIYIATVGRIPPAAA